MAASVAGTTALPLSSAGSPVRLWFDVESVAGQAQQPQTQQIANFDAKANEDCINGSTVAVNQHFVVYTVKNGLIRVLHRHSTLRALLRGHQGEVVTDCRFFQDGNVLATAGNSGGNKSTVLIWRIHEQPQEITAEKLLEITSTKTKISRIIWHPFNPNQFWMIHTNEHGKNMATLVETTRLHTQPKDNYTTAVFHQDYIIMENAITIQSTIDTSLYDLTDLTWSPRDPRHVLATYSSGEIVLWDLKACTPRGDGTLSPAIVQVVLYGEPLTRCLFLPHDGQAPKGGSRPPSSPSLTSCFATAAENNATITLWSPFTGDAFNTEPQKIQVLSLERPSPSYIVDVVYGVTPPDASPMSSFLVMADRHAGNVLAFHLRAQWDDTADKRTCLVGSDYVVPFQTKYPVFSWSVQCAPAADITEEDLVDQGGLVFDTKLFAYQSKLVQSLTLTSYMCLPPESSWVDPTPGVRLERLYSVQSAHVSVVDENEIIETVQYDEQEFEAYDDVEEDAEDVEDEDNTNDGAVQTEPNEMASNPFANWLGAIAAKSDAASTPLPPVPQTPAATTPQAARAASAPHPPASQTYAVPIVTAPPASDLPAPSGEPMAFLSPGDFLNQQASPPEKKLDQEKKEGPKKSQNKSGKKNSKKKDQGEVTVLKRDVTPISESKGGTGLGATVDIAKEIRLAVKEEMKNTVIPAIKNTVKDTLNASIIRPLQESVDNLASQGVTVDHNKISASVSEAVDPPLRAAFASNMKTVFIPTLECVTGQMLEKLSENLESSSAVSNGSSSQELAAMSSQLSTMTQLVAELTREVKALRDAQSQQSPSAASSPGAPAPASAVNQMEAMKGEITRLLAEKKFEAAFTRAVSASTAELAVFCCSNADVNEVLGMPIKLSQPIVICLMQQLGTVVATGRNTNLQVELEWLQDLAMSLDPTDAKISQHVPRVLQQLVTSINTRVQEGDPNLRRPLQRLLSIVRGIPMS